MTKKTGIGDRIREALATKGKRPVDLARALKVSQPTVHAWVHETHGITWANVRRIARELGVPPGWLWFGADEAAERAAQTAEELAFLRLLREKDDEGQAAILKFLTVLPTKTPNHEP